MSGLIRSTVRLITVATAAAAAAYAAYVTRTWKSYGHPPAPGLEENDELLDRFMPEYDVVERHSITMAAPAGKMTTTAAITSMPARKPIAAAKASHEVFGLDRCTFAGLIPRTPPSSLCRPWRRA